MKKPDEIELLGLSELKDPRFIRPTLVRYRQNGEEKSWEVVKAHDSVAILIYHRQKEAFVLVRQFRPAVYLGGASGMTVELCAGIVDKPLDLVQIAAEEIFEECGYEVSAAQIERITAFYTSVGFAGSKQTLFYAEVDEGMRRGEGGGVDGEVIEIVELPVTRARAFLFDESVAKTPGLMFAFMWWMDRFDRDSG